MASERTIIGQSTFVRGNVSGSGDLTIEGRVEGDVSATGEVVIEATGLVAANVSAARIVVRGAVKGDLVAEDSLAIAQGARVVGDLRAPRITIAQGGLVRGHVQTGAAGAARPRAASAGAASSRPRTQTNTMPATPTARANAQSVSIVNAPASVKETVRPARPNILAGSRPGPPPPVVPVLKKGTKAVQKKRHG